MPSPTWRRRRAGTLIEGIEWAFQGLCETTSRHAAATVFAIAGVVPPLVARIERGEGNVTNWFHASDAS